MVLPCYRYPSLAEVIAGGETFSAEDLRELVIPCVSEGLRAVHGQGEGTQSPIEWMVPEVTRDYELLLRRLGLEVKKYS